MIAKTDGILNRREFLKGALGTGAALALSGCGWRAASGHTTLTYNTFWTGRDAHTSAMNWLYSKFRELHPDVDLEVVQVAGGAADNGRKQMAGPLLYRLLKAQDLATSTCVVPNNPGIFDQKVFVPAIPDLFASLMEGATAKRALKVFAEDMRT